MKKYKKSHEWVEIEGDIATVGISEHAQEELGEIVFAELPEVGDDAKAGEVICTIESAKAVAEIKAPISGEITEVNEDLEDEPEIINEDSLGKGFLYKCKVSDASEAEKLMDFAAYKETL